MNNLSVSLWAVLFKEIVHAGGRVMIDIPGFPFIPSSLRRGLKKDPKKADEGDVTNKKSANLFSHSTRVALFAFLLKSFLIACHVKCNL